MCGEADKMEKSHGQLSVGEGARYQGSEHDDIVDEHRYPQAEATEVPHRRSQQLRRQPRGWSRAEWHADALVILTFSHEPHVLAVLPLEGKSGAKIRL